MPIVLGEHRKGDQIANRSRTNLKGQNYTMAYDQTGEKSCYDTLPFSRATTLKFCAEPMAAGTMR